MIRTCAHSTRLSIAILLITCLVSLLPTRSALAEGPQVRVQQGALRGVVSGRVATFKGIPFAAPPVGANRWRPPAAPMAWQGERDASKFGSACHQFTSLPLIPPGVGESEDCLTLNVWTPSGRPKQPLPVMLWIHGGSNTGGTGAVPYFSGERFASLGVVLVTINYRLGRLGYFAHPALTGADPKGPLANYGLLDQIEALRWVKANIAAFGGDPGRVTVFGESAGANAVLALMVSPPARGLFQRAIAQSGYARGERPVLMRSTPDQPSSPELAGAAFAKAEGITGDGPDALRALRALSVDQLKQRFATAEDPFRSPFVDGVVIPKPFLAAFAAGEYAHVPLIIGGNDFEASIETRDMADPDAVLRQTGDAARARALFDPSGGLGTKRAAQELLTARYVLEPSRRVAELMTANKTPTYLYLFSYLASGMRDRMPGAPHGGEIGYVFGTLPKQAIKTALLGDVPAANAADRAISDSMSAYWAAFAKAGEPGKAGGPAWPAYDSDKHTWMQFAVGGPAVRPGLHRGRMDWLRDLADKPAKASAPAAGPTTKAAR